MVTRNANVVAKGVAKNMRRLITRKSKEATEADFSNPRRITLLTSNVCVHIAKGRVNLKIYRNNLCE
ncbi:hypothetical protein OROHE_024328 [Orobanche hederae]